MQSSLDNAVKEFSQEIQKSYVKQIDEVKSLHNQVTYRLDLLSAETRYGWERPTVHSRRINDSMVEISMKMKAAYDVMEKAIKKLKEDSERVEREAAQQILSREIDQKLTEIAKTIQGWEDPDLPGRLREVKPSSFGSSMASANTTTTRGLFGEAQPRFGASSFSANATAGDLFSRNRATGGLFARDGAAGSSGSLFGDGATNTPISGTTMFHSVHDSGTGSGLFERILTDTENDAKSLGNGLYSAGHGSGSASNGSGGCGQQ